MDVRFIEKFELLKQIDEVKDLAIKRQRGLQFEELINDIFEDETTLLKRGYHSNDNRSEQVDGAVEIWNRVLLVEVKWVKSNLAASELFSFIGKIENKFQGTLGIFISRTKLSENFISALNRGRRQNVIVIHGDDIDLIFQVGSPPLSKYIEHCLKLFSYDTMVHYPYEDFVKGYQPPEELVEKARFEEREFITSYLNRKDDVPIEELRAAYYKLSTAIRKGVFVYVLTNIDRVWFSQKGVKLSHLVNNYLKFFTIIDPFGPEINGTEELYFGEKLPSFFTLYALEEIAGLYIKRYPSISNLVKVSFESKMVEQLKEAGKFNNEVKQRAISSFIELMWDQFETATHDALKEVFIYIELDSFLNPELPQKQFARKLLTEGMITREWLENWLQSKLPDYLRAFSKSYDVVRQFYLSFGKLAPYLGMDEHELLSYLEESLALLTNKRND
ncbi:restriction endonuclease [Pedobacter xixiisoli]|uniref:Restriction endonuclease n=1 Tax=Pedobacter xixiisoli TaxID=1476464 RepID=A0A286A748_9SPHI|nr:restriction endonuclease [Pedobacter xixiisoli]SOD17709.1 hypothetical protein SAMN06297358_2648 [Pedobacter xixiisoli]